MTWSRCIHGAGRMCCWLAMPRMRRCRRRGRVPARHWKMRGIWPGAWMAQAAAWTMSSRRLRKSEPRKPQGWRSKVGSSHAACSPQSLKPVVSATTGPRRPILCMTCRSWQPDGGRVYRCLVALTAHLWRAVALVACIALNDRCWIPQGQKVMSPMTNRAVGWASQGLDAVHWV